MLKKLPVCTHIAAIVPLYTQAGDRTAIITTDGTSTSTATTVRTVLRRLAP